MGASNRSWLGERRAAVESWKRRRAGGFGFDAAERRTVLLWCLSGTAGSGAFVAAFLGFSIDWGAIWKDIWMWLAVLLPGAVIGIGQRAILRRRCGTASSSLWLVGSIAGDVAFLAAMIPTDERLELAAILGLLGAIPGFLQMQDLDRRFVRGNWWMTLSGMSYALGCTLAYAVGDALPWGADAGVLLTFPCIAQFTGIGIVFVTRDPVR